MTVGVDDESAARAVQKADADGSNVVQARDVHGGIHLALGHDRRVLGWLSPYTEADALAAMPCDEAAKLLAQELIAVSARVVAALLSAHHELAISLLGSIERVRAEQLLAAAGTAAAGLEQLPEAAEAIAECAAGNHRLGDRVDRLRRAAPSRRKTQGYYEPYRDGAVHWSKRGGARVTTGAAWHYYASIGGSGGLLGFPLSDDMQAAPSQPYGTEGSWQPFEGPVDFSPELRERLGLQCGAALCWSAKHGAHATWRDIGEYYLLAGGTWGWLGFPVSDAVEAQGPERRPDGARTAGWFQRFEGGTVFYAEKTGAIGVPSATAGYHASRGDMGGGLGFPVSEEIDALASPYGTTGRCQRFEWVEDYPADILERWADRRGPGGATVYGTEAFGIHSVSGGIGRVYERLEGSGSWLGFPKADTVAASSSTISSGHAQTFEGGMILWNKKYRAAAVRADIIAKLGNLDGLLGFVGFPVAPESSLVEEPDTRLQWFEHGIVTVRNGTYEVWRRQTGRAQTDAQPAG